MRAMVEYEKRRKEREREKKRKKKKEFALRSWCSLKARFDTK